MDLAQPASCVASAEAWLAVIERQHGAIVAKRPAEEQQRLRNSISSHVQLYVSPNQGADRTNLGSVQDSEKAQFRLDLNIPLFNIGAPIVIVGCKADALVKSFSSESGNGTLPLVAGDRLEFLARSLRLVALNYGAAVAYTSAMAPVSSVSQPVNGSPASSPIARLQDYLWYRLLGSPNTPLPAQRYAVDGEDRLNAALFIPSGSDSCQLIDSSSSAPPQVPTSPRSRRRQKAADGAAQMTAAGRLVLSDDLSLAMVFSPTASLQSSPRDASVRADDDQRFLRALHITQDRDVSTRPVDPRLASAAPSASLPAGAGPAGAPRKPSTMVRSSAVATMLLHFFIFICLFCIS